VCPNCWASLPAREGNVETRKKYYYMQTVRATSSSSFLFQWELYRKFCRGIRGKAFPCPGGDSFYEVIYNLPKTPVRGRARARGI